MAKLRHGAPGTRGGEQENDTGARVDFHGTPLAAAEAAALQEIEAQLGFPLRVFRNKAELDEITAKRWPMDGRPYPGNGCVVAGGHVTMVNLISRTIDHNAWERETQKIRGIRIKGNTWEHPPVRQYWIPGDPVVENKPFPGLPLARLPASIGALSHLELLFLSMNALRTLPREIGRLTRLRGLRLDWNYLGRLPAEIGALTSLELLWLDHNRLARLPPEIGNLQALTHLTVRDNRLRALPASIGKLTRLEILDFERNILEALPDSIGDLRALTIFGVSNNRLRVLPESIGNFTKLTQFGAESNNLETLPESIGQLENLASLNVSSNPRLQVYPVSMTRLVALKHLELHFPPTTTLHDPAWADFYAWVHAIEDRGCIVGDGQGMGPPWAPYLSDIERSDY